MDFDCIQTIMDRNAARCAAFANGVRALLNARHIADKLTGAPLFVPIALDNAMVALASYDELTAMHELTACGKELINLLARDDCKNTAALDDIFAVICDVLDNMRKVVDKKTLELLALMD